MNEENIPVGMSAGGDNTYYVACDALGQKKAYCVCLHLNARYSEGADESDLLHGDCFKQMRRDGCEAVKMRKKEMEAGQALYYQPRKNVSIPVTNHDKASPGYARGWNQVGGKLDDLPTGATSKKTVTKASPQKSDVNYDQMDYGKIVNDLANDQAKGEVTVIASKGESIVTTAKPKSGESMLEMAKRIMNERKGVTV